MKLTKYFLILAIVASLVSCSDSFLDRPPKTSMSNELALANFTNIQLSLNGAYSALYSANYYGSDFIVLPEIRGNNAKSSLQLNTGRFQNNFNWAENEGNTSNLWNTAYYIISAANNVLEVLEDFSEPGVTDAMINQIKGEALFLRALVHWDLTRMYAQPYTYAVTQSAPASLGVPYMFKTVVSKPARNTVEEVYNFVIEDLTMAEGIIGTPTRGSVITGFASKEAVQALLAKVHLYKGDWQDAANYATEVIKSSRFSIASGANHVTAFSLNNSGSEAIFIVYGGTTQSYWGGYDEIGYIFSPDGYGDVCATNDLLSLYDAGDVRLGLFQTKTGLESEMWTKKYNGKPNNIRENNINVLRLSEMYLIRAEAIQNGATIAGASALADYNTIRTNRGLTAALAVSLVDIYDERRRELNHEGNGFWDISRAGRNVVRDGSDVHGQAPLIINFPDHRFALPIPRGEMEANENMVQNPGYN